MRCGKYSDSLPLHSVRAIAWRTLPKGEAISKRARVAELVDALVSGASGSNTVLVRVQSRAHPKASAKYRRGFFIGIAREWARSSSRRWDLSRKMSGVAVCKGTKRQWVPHGRSGFLRAIPANRLPVILCSVPVFPRGFLSLRPVRKKVSGFLTPSPCGEIGRRATLRG